MMYIPSVTTDKIELATLYDAVQKANEPYEEYYVER